MTEDSVSAVHVTCNKIMFPGLYFWVGGEILRDIIGQDHQTSVARISISVVNHIKTIQFFTLIYYLFKAIRNILKYCSSRTINRKINTISVEDLADVSLIMG